MSKYKQKKDITSFSDVATPWLTLEELAVYFKVSTPTVYKWVLDKSMPKYRLGQLWRFKANEVEDWVLNRKRKGSKK